MEDVERLLKGTVEELERMLNAKNVLGDPIEKDGATILPIVSFGFGFGAGGGTGGKAGAQGSRGGTGGGGGIKPLGAIIIDDRGARVEAIKGAVTNVASVLGEAAARALAKKNGETETQEKEP
ncbi:MAG: spore germination protein GerW family protein [Pseudomonadota bacterium]